MNTEKIGAEGTEPPGAPPRSGVAHSRDIDEQLDAALACTYPASDPVGCLGTFVNCRPDRPARERPKAADAG
jgi:hypothetical protein